MLRVAYDFLFAPKRFKPSQMLSSFSEIVMLAKVSRAKLIIFDKDDTLTPLHHFSPKDPRIVSTIAALREQGIKMFILSNSVKPGDPESVSGIPIMHTQTKKPFNQGEVRSLIGGVEANRVWIVGDRLMTDIYLANRLGCRSALVPPVDQTTIERHGVVVWLFRGVEKAYMSINGWKQ